MKSKKSRIVKRTFRVVCKRMVALLFATALLFSCVSVGVIRQKPLEVKAVAAVDDVVALAESLKIIFAFACSAGGASNSDILTDAESAGITDYPSAKDYVHGTFSGDSNFCSIFEFDPVEMIKVESAIASACLAGGKIFNKTFFNQLWATYDPAKDGWDPEKWGGLKEHEKVNLIYDLGEALSKLMAYGPGPYPDDDDDDEDEEEPNYNEKGEPVNSSGEVTVLDSALIGMGVATATFKAVYTLTKMMNEDDQNTKFNNESNQEYGPYICDYSVDYWKVMPKTMTIVDKTLPTNYVPAPGFYPGFFPTNFTSDVKLYPLLWWDKDIPRFCLASSIDSTDRSCYGVWFLKMNDGSLEDVTFTNNGNFYWSDGYILSEILNYGLDQYAERYAYDIKNRNILDPSEVMVTCPHMIDCGTYENVKKFRELVKTGDYTVDDIRKLMVDGWKGDRKKSWSAIDDKGETTKKVVESEKGDKYQRTGSKTDSSGQTSSGQKGVTFSSFVDGMNTVPSSSTSSSGEQVLTGVQDLLGEQTTLTNPVTYPSSSEFPSSFTDPDSKPEPEPEPEPQPEPNPEEEEELEDIDPDEVQTPELLKKFPFCVPWDVIDLVTTVGAEKKAPKFELPIVLHNEDVNIDEKVVIDFAQYEKLAEICRWFFRLMFIAGLVVLTRFIIKG